MESRIMQVFYGNDCLPYKDSARSVHYPIVGNSFIGASGTTQIRFYVRDIGGVNNVSWVAISKLPNGQIGNQVLSTIALDSELGEYYAALDLGSYYTQLKGDVYISLNGYQGGIQVEQDAGTGIYTITGTPIIEATGSIKLAINYAPQLPLGHHFQIDDLQQILGLMSEKANIVNTVQVVANITTEDLTGYDNGQLFYDLYEKQYYKKKATSPYYEVAEDGNGILGSKRALVRYQLDFSTTTLEQLFSLAKYNISLIKGGYFSDYLVKFDYITALNKRIRIVNLNTLETWTTTTDVLDLSNYISALINDTYKDEILHINNYKNFAVPYSGATANVDLNSHNIKSEIANGDNTKKGGFDLGVTSSGGTNWHGYLKISSQKYNQDYQSVTEYATSYIEYAKDFNLGQTHYMLYFPEEDGTLATREWTTSAIETLKANAFILVDTTTYPTLNDFLASQGEEGYIYLYPSTNQEQGYLEYIWESNDWLLIGTTQIDLTNYYTKTQADDKFVPYNGGTKDVNLGNHSLTAKEIDIKPTNMAQVLRLRFYKGGTTTNIGSIEVTPTGSSMTFDVDNHLYRVRTGSNTYEEIATKEYASANYVAQTNNGEKVYGTDELGAQMTYSVDSDLVGSGAIVRRETSTGTVVVGTPTSSTHATTKQYVDNAISNAIASVYKIKGSASVSQINAMTNQQVGDVYNVTDSGTIVLGNLQVFTGDNIVWTGSAWDKLGAEIDWSAYDEKFIAAGFFEVQPYNENTGEITFVYSTELYIMSYDSDTGIMTIQAN